MRKCQKRSFIRTGICLPRQSTSLNWCRSSTNLQIWTLMSQNKFELKKGNYCSSNSSKTLHVIIIVRKNNEMWKCPWCQTLIRRLRSWRTRRTKWWVHSCRNCSSAAKDALLKTRRHQRRKKKKDVSLSFKIGWCNPYHLSSRIIWTGTKIHLVIPSSRR